MQTIEYCKEEDVAEQLEKMLTEASVIDHIEITGDESDVCRIVVSSHAESSAKRIKVVLKDEQLD